MVGLIFNDPALGLFSKVKYAYETSFTGILFQPVNFYGTVWENEWT